MLWKSTVLPVLGVLVAISLATTVIALGLQAYFGRPWFLILLGQILAAIGAAAIVLWLK